MYISTRYMADELLNNSERLPSADIFSLGLTIYEMCCFAFEEDIAMLHDASNNQNENDQNDRHHQQQQQQQQHSSDNVTPQPSSMFFTVHRGLPSEGPSWHTLRENRAPRIPSYHSKTLSDVVNSMMEAQCNDRPTAKEFLLIHDVLHAESYDDESLMNVPRPIDNRHISRSISFNPTAEQRLQIEVTITTTSGGGNGIDYDALGDRAFTPHFNNSSSDTERSLTPLFQSK